MDTLKKPYVIAMLIWCLVFIVYLNEIGIILWIIGALAIGAWWFYSSKKIQKSFYCTNCRHSVAPVDEYCINCGSKLRKIMSGNPGPCDGNYCNKCGKDSLPGEKWCTFCGNQKIDQNLRVPPSRAMYCVNCGNEVQLEDKFCLNCSHETTRGI